MNSFFGLRGRVGRGGSAYIRPIGNTHKLKPLFGFNYNSNSNSNNSNRWGRLLTTMAQENKYYAIFYEYKYKGEELLNKRAPFRPAHLEHVNNAPQVKMGGAWGDLAGAMLIFHGTQKDAHQFVTKDPYVVTKSYRGGGRRERETEIEEVGVGGERPNLHEM